jgi:tRNA pseudouridine55 synthase
LMEHPTDGIMLVDKTEGETSFDVVRRARGVFQTRKVGHAGTLDPFASGLLIILLGQGTKLSNFLMSQKKLYQGTLLLGVETDTLDVTGRTTETRPVHELERDEVLEKCRSLVGEIEQSPPLYSALRWKGTYVRSLAADIGSSLGTGAHLVSLRRLASGRFLSDQALASERLNRDLSPVVLKDRVIPLNQSLPDMEKWDVDASMARRIRQGYQPAWKELPFGPCILNGRDGYVKIVKEEELIAVMSIQIQGVQGGPRTKLMRVFE